MIDQSLELESDALILKMGAMENAIKNKDAEIADKNAEIARLKAELAKHQNS